MSSQTQAQARSLIADWRKVLNTYRSASRTISREYIALVDGANDDGKVAAINIFGIIYF